MRGEGHTRDISPSGVFVLTSDRLMSGTAVKLEVVLPSLHEEKTGASLRTQGHLVRSEEVGFAAVADMGFRMRFNQNSSMEQSFDKGRANGRLDSTGEEASAEKTVVRRSSSNPRFWI